MGRNPAVYPYAAGCVAMGPHALLMPFSPVDAPSSAKDVEKDRFDAVRAIQKKYGGAILLKGAGTLVCGEDGVVSVTSEGNPGMASGGMGDTLTGIITGAFHCHDLAGQRQDRGMSRHVPATRYTFHLFFIFHTAYLPFPTPTFNNRAAGAGAIAHRCCAPWCQPTWRGWRPHCRGAWRARHAGDGSACAPARAHQPL